MKKSYCCEKLEKTLHFLPEEIKFCCSCAEGLGVKIKDYSKIDKKEVISAKKNYIKQLKNGIIPKQCQGCIEIKESEPSKQSLFEKFLKKEKQYSVSHIIVDHYKQCDCFCVYCSQKILHPDVTQNYDLLPIVEQLYEQNLLSKQSLVVEFQGGNVSMLKEFDNLLKIFYANNCREFRILMNGIKYLPVLETISYDLNSFVSISLDSGTRETFHKIKGVDAFEKVISNVRILQEKTGIGLSFKYIFVLGINDNKEEVLKFINVVSTFSNVFHVVFEIDYRNTFMSGDNSFKMPYSYIELFSFAKNKCKEFGLNYISYDYTNNLLVNLSQD